MASINTLSSLRKEKILLEKKIQKTTKQLKDEVKESTNKLVDEKTLELFEKLMSRYKQVMLDINTILRPKLIIRPRSSYNRSERNMTPHERAHERAILCARSQIQRMRNAFSRATSKTINSNNDDTRGQSYQ
jgi:hypothetical protein